MADGLVPDPEQQRRDRLAMIAATSRPSFLLPSSEPLSEPTDIDEEERRRLIERAGGLSTIGAPAARPAKPTATPGTMADTENRLDRIQWEKEHPWGTPGSTHPGTLGKIGHVAAKIGNIAGDILAPGTMSMIPGTELHRNLEEERLTDVLGQQKKEASEEGLRNVQEENLRSEIEARRNPKPKLLSGEENVAVGPHGERLRAYEMGDQTIQWRPEGGGTLQPIGPTAAGTPGGALPNIAGQLPAGATVGKPLTGEPKFIADYLKDHNLEDTAENRQKAQDEYKAGGGIGPDRAKQYTSQIANVLKNTGIEPSGYTVTDKSTAGDAKEALAAAQKAANEYRAVHAPDQAARRKDQHSMGYAMDPSGKLVYTNKAQADDWGSIFEEMKPDAVNKDRQSLRQLNDIQKNISAYRKALDSFTGPIENHAAMRRILAGVNASDVEKMGYLTAGAAMDMMEHGEVANAWNDLTPQERDAMIGYLRSKGAMIAYNRVVSGSARTNKEALEVEWNNLPLPYVGATVADPQMRAMQENLDQVNMGFPTNLPGMRTPEEVQRTTEGGRAAEVPAGARIRTYNANTGKLE